MSMLLLGVGVSSPNVPAYPTIAGTLAMFVDTDPVYTDTGATVLATTQGDAIAAWKDSRTNALLVQSTSGRRMGLRLDSTNNRRSLAYNYEQGNQGGFAWPTGVSINARDCSLWVVVRQTEVNADFCEFNPGPGLTDFLVDSSGISSSHPLKYRLYGTGASNGDTSIPAYCDESLIVVRAGPSSATLSRNDDTFTSASAFAAGTLSTGTFLARQDGYPLRGEIFACGIVDHALTTEELATLKLWAYARFMRPAATKQLVTRGDSRTVGNGTTLGKNWPCLVIDEHLPSGWRLWNQALDGTNCSTASGDITVASTSLFNGAFSENIYAHFLGTNDIGDLGRTAAQLISDTSTVLTAMRAAGFTTVVATEVSRTGGLGWDSTREGYKDDFNMAVRPGGSLASLVDVLVDLGGDSLLNDPNNSTYRKPDVTHFTQAGSDRIASLFATGILAA